MSSGAVRLAALCAMAVLMLAQGARAQTVPLDPESPMAPLPELGVDWPDLTKNDPLLPSPEAAAPIVDAPDNQR